MSRTSSLAEVQPQLLPMLTNSSTPATPRASRMAPRMSTRVLRRSGDSAVLSLIPRHKANVQPASNQNIPRKPTASMSQPTSSGVATANRPIPPMAMLEANITVRRG